MKKVITPFLFGLMLAVSSTGIFADSSPVLGNYDGGESVQVLALAESSQPIFEMTKHQQCVKSCMIIEAGDAKKINICVAQCDSR